MKKSGYLKSTKKFIEMSADAYDFIRKHGKWRGFGSLGKNRFNYHFTLGTKGMYMFLLEDTPFVDNIFGLLIQNMKELEKEEDYLKRQMKLDIDWEWVATHPSLVDWVVPLLTENYSPNLNENIEENIMKREKLYFTVTNVRPDIEYIDEIESEEDLKDFPYANGEESLLEDGKIYSKNKFVKHNERYLRIWEVAGDLLEKNIDEIEEQIKKDFLWVNGILYQQYGFYQLDDEELKVEFLPDDYDGYYPYKYPEFIRKVAWCI